jgi:crossover junction endodeoxyribonuclease RuvC
MISLGIDPGTTRIGFGLVEYDNVKFKCLDYGILKISKNDTLAAFQVAEKEIAKLLAKYKPDIIGIEKLFFFANKKTVMPVSEMRGVLMLSLSKNPAPIIELTPLQIKQGLSGYGRANKDQVQKMIQIILGLTDKISPDDAADALGIAICAVNNYTPLIK